MNRDGLEIERKYLLAEAPTASQLAELGAQARRIEQFYLRPAAGAFVRRARRIEAGGRSTYLYTEKGPPGRSGIIREEHEREIDAGEYLRLQADADPSRRPIRKTRHVFPYGDYTFELDVFDEPSGLVIVEVELSDASQLPPLPPTLRVVRDVSEDPAYFNVNLALR